MKIIPENMALILISGKNDKMMLFLIHNLQ